MLSATAIIVFSVLTALDKNLLYCIIIAHFGIVLVVSVRIVLHSVKLWDSDHARSIFVYVWLSL